MNLLKKFLTILPGVALLTLGVTISRPSHAASLTLADSVSEFSGTQGQNNWYYGYYNSPFSSANFKLMNQYDGIWWLQNG